MNIGPLLPKFYDCACGQLDWADVSVELARTFHASALMLASGSPSLGHASFDVHQVGFDESVYSESEFGPEANFDRTANPAYAMSLTSTPRQSFNGGAPIYETNPRARKFYNEILLPSDVVSARVVMLAKSRSTVTGGFVARGRNQPSWSNDEVQALDTCFQHLGNALDLWTRLESSARLSRGLVDKLGSLGHGIIVLGTDRIILWSNESADDMLGAGTYVQAVDGRLTLSDQKAGSLLDKAVEAGEGRLSLSCVGTSVRCGLQVFPATGLVSALPASSGEACIILSDPTRTPSASDVARLALELGLTRAEARVAVLVPHGFSKPEIATQLGLSEETIRTHIRSMREKAGARNMTALALIIASAVP